MSSSEPTSDLHQSDTAPGDQRLSGTEIAEGVKSYLVGLGLAVLLTVVSFFISGTTLIWGPSIPVALVVLAIAQMGVHLVFFLHITTGPDNVNNVMALAFGVLIVLLLLTGSLWIMAHLNQNMAPMDQTMPMQLENEPMGRTVTASAVVGPAATAPVGSRVSGVIQALYCDANMHVKAGQLCAKIDPRSYQIAVDRKKADLASAEARLEKENAALAQTKADLVSHEALAKPSRKAIAKSRRAFERAETQTKHDEARVAQLQTALHAAETNLGFTDIVSPVDGTVVSRNVERGQSVTADSQGPPLFVIAESALTDINARFGAKDIGEVKIGDKATFTAEAFSNHPFSGVVTQIRPSPQAHEQTYDVVIHAPNPDLLLKAGMAGRIRIMIGRQVEEE
ncbi:cytochrome o ubiquinol oxidase subunit IV [Beijerinckiaceae bacterium]|nr:cytochrome o ubiquinol oxidase subunit IV [Beijerinckiaceae bacterium]